MKVAKPTTRKQSHQLRKGRVSLPGQTYLVTTTTEHRHRCFNDLNAGRLVVEALIREQRIGHAQTLAFVVMPDHLHWLLSLTGAKKLSTTVGNVKAISAKRINASLTRSGVLWQCGFHDRAIRSEEDLPAVARYIVANPLRAGLVDDIGDYPLWDAVW
jgi:putative transposase